MRIVGRCLITIGMVMVGLQAAQAGFIGMPRSLGAVIERIAFQDRALPPMAFTQFCMRYTDQCRPQRIMFRGGPVRLTTERWRDLNEVNKDVNASIAPERNTEGLAGEKWLIGPSHGDCNDYAVTKRSELIQRGWPSRALLLSEVVTSWGEHHLILVVRTSSGDFVLDNMSRAIRPWSKLPYQWVRMQMPENPNHWASVASRRIS